MAKGLNQSRQSYKRQKGKSAVPVQRKLGGGK